MKTQGKSKGCWLVFISQSYVRDAQAYLGDELPESHDIHDSEMNEYWIDIGCPALCAEFKNMTLAEVKERIHKTYPQASMDIFQFYSFIPVVSLKEDYDDVSQEELLAELCMRLEESPLIRKVGNLVDGVRLELSDGEEVELSLPKKFVLIEVEDDEISQPAFFQTKEAAYTEMEQRYNELRLDGEEGELGDDYALIRTYTTKITWNIFQV